MRIAARIFLMFCILLASKASAIRRQVCTFETNSPSAGGGDTNRVGYYYHQDQLTSSSVLGDSTGIRQVINAYYPFGRTQTASPQASFKVSRQFTGQVKDDETGLYYYNFRFYDAEIGRFIQADDIIPDLANPQSYNRYSYVMNNPLKYTDPSGHEEVLNGASGRRLLQEDDADASRVVQSAHQSAKTMATVIKTTVAITPAGTAIGIGEAWTGKEGYGSGDQLSTGQRVGSGVLAVVPGIVKIGGKALTAGEVIATDTAKAAPNLGRKLDFILGKSTGSVKNIQRSETMLAQLKSIGLFDNAETRQLLTANLTEAFKHLGVAQANGRILRESLLMGPNGGLKVASVWENDKLITVILHGGRK